MNEFVLDLVEIINVADWVLISGVVGERHRIHRADLLQNLKTVRCYLLEYFSGLCDLLRLRVLGYLGRNRVQTQIK